MSKRKTPLYRDKTTVDIILRKKDMILIVYLGLGNDIATLDDGENGTLLNGRGTLETNLDKVGHVGKDRVVSVCFTMAVTASYASHIVPKIHCHCQVVVNC